VTGKFYNVPFGSVVGEDGDFVSFFEVEGGDELVGEEVYLL